jgi:hypothetical protein
MYQKKLNLIDYIIVGHDCVLPSLKEMPMGSRRPEGFESGLGIVQDDLG